MKNKILSLVIITVTTGVFAQTSPNEIINMIVKVNQNWQDTHPVHANAFWHPAAYHTGNMAAYEITGDERFRVYSEE